MHPASLFVTEYAVREALREVIDPELGENLVFDPPWTPDRMSTAAKQRLGFS